MKNVIVLSSQAQYEHVIEQRLPLSEWQVLCDNERLYDFLHQKKVSFDELTEFDFREKWNDINAWGWSRAAGLIRLAQKNRSFHTCDFPSIIYLWLTVFLILALKNRIRAEQILKKYAPQEIVIFDSVREPRWPEYSGNVFLNEFLRELSQERGLTIQSLRLDEARAAILPDSSSPFKKFIRKGIKKAIHAIYGWAVRAPERADVMVYGTLRHLASTTVLLRERGLTTLFYDDEFRKEHFQFCRQNKISYLLPGCFAAKSAFDAPAWARSLTAEFDLFVKSVIPRNYFVFDSIDLSGFIGKHFWDKAMDAYIQQLSQQMKSYENILAKCDIASLLLDEDFNAHAAIAAFMKAKGRPVFCNSHANMALDCKVDNADCAFEQSFTFVHSQHEKETYIERGWVSDSVIVTGMPRYDRLVQTAYQKQHTVNKSKPQRILYCAGLLWPYSPDVVGFVGCDMFGFKRSQEKALRFLLDAIRGLDVTVVIKPHYAEDEAMWSELIRREGKGCRVEVVKASEDYFGLLLQSDAMVLCLWSSTLIEAGLAGVPVFYLDLEKQNSRQAVRLAQSGLCEIFSDPQLFRSRLEGKISITKNQSGLSPERDYFLGASDDRAGQRVSDFICKQLGKFQDVKV